MENGSQNAREIHSQNAAKLSVIGSETNGRTALHGRAALAPEKNPPKVNSNRTPALIIGPLQPGWQSNLPCMPTWRERGSDL
jgi:hypothetical protein